MGQYSDYLMQENKMLTDYIRDHLDVSKIKQIVRSSQRENLLSPNNDNITHHQTHDGAYKNKTETGVYNDFGNSHKNKKTVFNKNKAKPLNAQESFIECVKNKIFNTDFGNNSDSSKDNDNQRLKRENSMLESQEEYITNINNDRQFTKKDQASNIADQGDYQLQRNDSNSKNLMQKFYLNQSEASNETHAKKSTSNGHEMGESIPTNKRNLNHIGEKFAGRKRSFPNASRDMVQEE